MSAEFDLPCKTLKVEVERVQKRSGEKEWREGEERRGLRRCGWNGVR